MPLPAILASLLGGLLSVVSSVVGRVLVSLGIGFTVYSGLDVALSFLRDQAVSRLQSLPPEVVGLISYLGVGSALNIVFSALAAKMVLNGVVNGAKKALEFK